MSREPGGPDAGSPDAGSPDARLRLREVFGLDPLWPGLRDCLRAVVGGGGLPPTRFGLSSLRIFKPWISLPAWLGRARRDGRVPIYNFVNRKAPPPGRPYSVRVTDCEDFQGGRWTYDGHVGTDLALPVGTAITAAAPGHVLRVRNDMNRGGLKVFIDHGGGLITSSNHLARALVREGDAVRRGQVIALSGMSSVDGLLFFPWLAPHLHFNVFLDGRPVDPFARPDETPLWRDGDAPRPAVRDSTEALPARTQWSEEGVKAALEACRDPELRDRIAVLPREEQAIELFIAQNFFSPLFDAWPALVAESRAREPWLELPVGESVGGRPCLGVALPPQG